MESLSGLQALRAAGVRYGQGYAIGRPGSMPAQVPEEIAAVCAGGLPTHAGESSARLRPAAWPRRAEWFAEIRGAPAWRALHRWSG